MKLLRTILLALLALVLVALGAVLFLVNDWTRGPLPILSGEVRLGAVTVQAGESASPIGLSGEVEIIRDNWGVPHIYADTTYDLFYGQGYTQAQDRWWQMEFARHIGSGRIQELTGRNADVMGSDVFIRVSGWRAAAERDWAAAGAEETATLQAFADGVNAYILNRDKSDLAMEYNLLGVTGVNITIQPWSPVDSLVWAKVMAWDLSGNRSTELIYSALVNKLGEAMAQDWLPPYPYDEKPTILQAEDLPLTEQSAALPGMIEAGRPVRNTVLAGGLTAQSALIHHESDIGSNNWVVSGSLSATGLPLLANDPHLGIQMPSIWYEVGLHCRVVNADCPYEVTGFALPATPAVIIGHNGRIAWGVTNVGPDTQDLYALTINPEKPLQYQWNGAWREMTTREEAIRFGDSTETVTIQVRETHLGPVINDYAIGEDGAPGGYTSDEPMALRWTALQERSTLMLAVLKLNQAQNWADFRAALRYWDSPSQNVVYADVDGNIGYQMPGNIPIRAAGHSGLLPVDGSTDAFEWRGYIPFDNLPRIFNPERSYIATANEAVVPPAYYEQLRDAIGTQFGMDSNYVFALDWDFGYRAQRIEELLTSTGPHTADTFKAIQGDNQFISAMEVQPYLEALDFGADYNAERDWLFDGWDYQFTIASQQAGLYAYFWRELAANYLNDQAEGIFTAGGSDQLMWMLHQLLEQPSNAWWDDARTPDVVETRDDILIASFRGAVDRIRAERGAERGGWRWGDMHTSTFVSNPLGLSGIDLIEQMVNRGPFPTAGGSAIVNATSWNFSDGGGFEVTALPSMRFIADLGDLSASQTMHTTGQSGHPFSPHYSDMIDPWRLIQYHLQLWTRAQVEAAQVDRLVLRPADS
jgi:penicillin amidase